MSAKGMCVQGDGSKRKRRKDGAVPDRFLAKSFSYKDLMKEATDTGSGSESRECLCRSSSFKNGKGSRTLADFMKIIGQSMKELSINDLANYSNRDLLRLSGRWCQMTANAHSTSRRRDKDVFLISLPISELYKITDTLSEECARMEVEAIALLSSMKGPGRLSSTENRMVHDSDPLDYPDGDDDDMEAELQRLDELQDSLSLDLLRAETELMASWVVSSDKSLPPNLCSDLFRRLDSNKASKRKPTRKACVSLSNTLRRLNA